MKKFIVIPVLICLCFVLSACGKRLVIKDYVKAYNDVSAVTNIVQINTIYDGETMVNRIATYIEKDGVNVKSTIKVQKLAPIDSDELFITSEDVVYYTNNARYSKVDGNWVKEDGEFKAETIKLNIQEGFLEEITFDNELGAKCTLKAKVKTDSVAQLLNVTDIKVGSVYLELVINSDKKLVQCNINYKTASAKSVVITTTYGYNANSVTLPQV